MGLRVAHRGPDAFGAWALDWIGLAHARLSVIDLSPNAAQPMPNDDGSVCIVFNGEIYNFRELRVELEARGYVFRSRSDTEVLLHGYREWGECLFGRLCGMFALAICDVRARRLVLARDHFGQKPLFYHQSSECFLFGSEIKTILAWPGCPRRADFGALATYLVFGYTVAAETAFEGIHRLLPGHYMTVTPGGTHAIHRYWQVPHPRQARPRPIDELKVELVERLREAVRRHLVSDVPLGMFLSGGVDSSTVVALAAPYAGKRMNTFSVGFGTDGYDETEFAQMVASRYNTEHHCFRSGPELMEVLPRVVWHYGEPYADSSALVTFHLAEQTRREVTVALTGDAGDELFLGYPRYAHFRQLCVENVLQTQAEEYRQRFESLVGHDLRRLDLYGYMIEKFRHQHSVRGFDLRLLPYLERDSYAPLAHFSDDNLAPDALASWMDLHTYLPDDLLVKMDVATMAHGLEARSPFLDREFAEWAMGIPANQKTWGSEGKALLKSAMEPFLPREVLYRPKMGFRVPVAQWMANDLKRFIRELLVSDRFADRRLVRRAFVARMLDEHESGRTDHGTRIWALTMLELWFRTFIDTDQDRPLNMIFERDASGVTVTLPE